MFLREWHVKRELRMILGQTDRPLRVLDAGSGFGQYTYYCATRFPRVSVCAVDVKSEQIEDCRRFFEKAKISNAQFAVEDLASLDHNEVFDLALSIDVMEHIADDVLVFRNLHRSLKPGGVLLVNTPSNLGGSDAHGPEEKSFIEEHARTGYSVREIRTKLESAGFKIERVRFTYGPWGSLSWRLGIKYPMVMLNLSKLFFLLLPLYYLITLPFTLLLMYLDYALSNKTGTGLLVTARKH
jgi:SAM-dependent methyltransferase